MSSKAFTAQVFAWLHQVNADRALPASGAKVAIYLASCFNEAEGGAAWPAVETIGEAIGRAASNVVHALRLMQSRGHLRVVWGKQGRGHSSRYWMTLKPLPAEVFKPQSSQRRNKVPSVPSVSKKTSVSASENFCFDPLKLLPAEETLLKTHLTNKRDLDEEGVGEEGEEGDEEDGKNEDSDEEGDLPEWTTPTMTEIPYTPELRCLYREATRKPNGMEAATDRVFGVLVES